MDFFQKNWCLPKYLPNFEDSQYIWKKLWMWNFNLKPALEQQLSFAKSNHKEITTYLPTLYKQYFSIRKTLVFSLHTAWVSTWFMPLFFLPKINFIRRIHICNTYITISLNPVLIWNTDTFIYNFKVKTIYSSVEAKQILTVIIRQLKTK